MSKKILIFGDSYADPIQFPRILTADSQTIPWYDLLKEEKNDYEIINHGISATGPHYSMKEYYKFISGKVRPYDSFKKEDCIVIFFLSGEDRINWPHIDEVIGTHIDWNFYSLSLIHI